MTATKDMSRRWLLGVCAGSAAFQLAWPARAAAPGRLGGVMDRAMEAFQRHAGRITSADMMAVADFSAPSRAPRLHLIDRRSGTSATFLVAHGRGSDPGHSGWVERFSNAPGSFASSAGAYLVGADYIGRHGRSRRLIGLDAANSNAEARAIVIHAASYVGPEIIREQGKLGRSEGCFAVSPGDLTRVLDMLPPGALLYADKV